MVKFRNIQVNKKLSGFVTLVTIKQTITTGLVTLLINIPFVEDVSLKLHIKLNCMVKDYRKKCECKLPSRHLPWGNWHIYLYHPVQGGTMMLGLSCLLGAPEIHTNLGHVCPLYKHSDTVNISYLT